MRLVERQFRIEALFSVLYFLPNFFVFPSIFGRKLIIFLGLYKFCMVESTIALENVSDQNQSCFVKLLFQKLLSRFEAYSTVTFRKSIKLGKGCVHRDWGGFFFLKNHITIM